MTAARAGLTAEQWKAVEEALPELRKLAQRLRRRCPHKSIREIEALAQDALISRVHRWDSTRSRLIDFARRHVPGDVVRAAYSHEGDGALRAMDAHEETITVLDTASRWAETPEAKDARALALGQDMALAGLYGHLAARAAKSPEDEYASRESFEGMKRIAAATDPRAPALFDLLYEGGLTWDEASTQLGLDLRQAQRIEARALDRLRSVLTARTSLAR